MFRQLKENTFAGGHLLPMGGSYFERRAGLACLHSEFECDENCSRPGCKKPDMHIETTIYDLMGAAFYRNKPVDEIYRKNYSLGPMPLETQIWIVSVSLKLKKPCPYLEHDRCSIYPVRPLACMLFPEYDVVAKTFAQRAGQARFKEYHCFRRPFEVSRERAEAIGDLGTILRRESLLSNAYLFGNSPYWIDFHTLSRELQQEEQKKQSKTPCEGEAMQRQTLQFEILEQGFARFFKDQHPFRQAEAKLLDLKESCLQERLFSDLNDRTLYERLVKKREDRALVFRMVKGRLQTGRKSLISSNLICVG